MKKIWILFLSLMLLLSFTAACQADAPVQTEGIEVPVVTNMKQFEIPDNEALRFVRELKVGWNLGNTFDAFDGFTKHATGAGMETIWVGTRTTPELFSALKEAGFRLIRMPVSWHNHVDEQNQVDEAWLNRVVEVAHDALNEGLYVIVNTHHDNDLAYYYPDEAHYERSAAYLSAIWKQMAEAFADCDDHLILESMNEPRLVGTAYEWSWQEEVPACQEAAACINKLNQLFVDTVRATGGNNATRYLSVPAYDASPWYACNEAFQLPTDTAENRILVATHAYTPYEFALNRNNRTDTTFDLEKDDSKKSEIGSMMNALYERFVSRGIPVVMDEFGALDKGGNLQDRVNFASYYVASASARGITCCWWDNHAFVGNGELFGLINRKNCEWTYPDIALAIMRNCEINR